MVTNNPAKLFFVPLSHFAVPLSEVNISLSHDPPPYVGTTITLTCTATLHINVNTDKEVTATWSGPEDIIGERFTISQSTLSRRINNSLTISPLTVQDEGMYTCTVTVSGESRSQCIIDASDEVWINVLSKLLSEDIFGLYTIISHSVCSSSRSTSVHNLKWILNCWAYHFFPDLFCDVRSTSGSGT